MTIVIKYRVLQYFDAKKRKKNTCNASLENEIENFLLTTLYNIKLTVGIRIIANM